MPEQLRCRDFDWLRKPMKLALVWSTCWAFVSFVQVLGEALRIHARKRTEDILLRKASSIKIGLVAHA